MQNKTTSILLISDMVGCGKLAISAMLPILSHFKFQVCNLPTALVSNNFNYGKYTMVDTTEYLENTLKCWNELNFKFDAICTGFLASDRQAIVTYEYCKKAKESGDCFVLVDPIMGDDGSLYYGIPESTIEHFKKICPVSDMIVPNITEACLLTDYEMKKDFSKEDIAIIIDRLKKLGSKAIILTSTTLEGKTCTIVQDTNASNFTPIYYEEIPVKFNGTGDIFTALLATHHLKGDDLETAVTKSMRTLEKLIKESMNVEDKFLGIPIEEHLDEL